MTTSHHDHRSDRLRRYFARGVLVLLPLIACGSALALSCADLDAALNADGANFVAESNAARASCLASSPPNFCGAVNPGFNIESRTVAGGIEKRIDKYATNSPSEGSQLVHYAYSEWYACTSSSCTAGPAGFHRGVVAGEKVNPFNTCQDGCVTAAIPRLDLGVSVTTGSPVQTYATWELVRKADACDPATSGLPSLPSSGTTPSQPTPEAQCPAGQRRVYFASGVPTCAPIPEDRFCPPGYTYGTINGKDTCISQSSGPPTASSPATTDKTPATESKESSTTVTNPDGSTTTTTTKSDGRGGGSVTTTTKSSDGKTVESVTKKMGDDPDGKCEPGTLGCMKPGTPSGDGPAKSERTVTLGGAGLSGFSSECPADRNIDTQFGTVHVSFSSACSVAPNLKPLILLAAALIAMSIVVGALRS